MTTAVTLSFKDRLRQRRAELEAARPFILPVNGYDGLYARYRVLDYEDMRAVAVAAAVGEATREIETAADVLVTACLGLLEESDDAVLVDVVVDGNIEQRRLRDLDYRWTLVAARDLFGIDLPAEATGRDVMRAVFPAPRTVLLMQHFMAYTEQTAEVTPEVDAEMAGESLVPSEGILLP